MQSADSIELTRVGPGTVMGTFMRQYWVPALMSSELVADGDPVRVMLLGEKLIAFRDSAGRVGVLDHRCPHRCASLFLGRNELGGIRCVYHGWKFDVDGNCVDMPNVPARQDFRERVHARSYRALERNGLVWVYMGDESAPPALPQLEANLLPESEIWCQQRDCNWLQALEGDIDTSHVGFLHVGSLNAEDLPEDHPMRPTVLNRAPEYDVRSADWGAMYGGFRPNDNGMMSWRVAHYLFPFWTMTPNIRFASRTIARAWVPQDDEHVMVFNLTGGVDDGNPAYNTKRLSGEDLYSPFPYAPNTTDWFGRWRSRDGIENDWGIDRSSQRSGTQYTGIANVSMQDQAVTESMGPITDHQREHLSPSDQMIALTRRRILLAARAFRDKAIVPPGIVDPSVYFKARSGSFLHEPGIKFEVAYEAQLSDAVRWGESVP